MPHYRLDALNERDGRLYLGGKPFTGVAYEVLGDRVMANVVVTDGVRGGPEVVWNPSRIRVLYQALTAVTPDEIDDRHPVVGDYLGDELFRGVAYTFDPDTGMLLEEVDFDVDGGGPSREWYPSGALRAERDRIRPDGKRESVSYDESGRTLSVSTYKVRWSLTPELRLRNLYLAPGFLESDFQRVSPQVDTMLRLCGGGVTDRVVKWLRDLPKVSSLDLDKTGITAAGLALFSVCVDLRELVTYTNSSFTDNDVHALLSLLPNCKWERR